MNRLLIFAALVSICGCAGVYRTTFDHERSNDPIKIRVIPILSQDQLLVPFEISTNTMMAAGGGASGASGVLFAAAIGGSINRDLRQRSKRSEFILDIYDGEFSYRAAIDEILRAEANRDSMMIVEIDKLTEKFPQVRFADDLFDNSDADAVVILDFGFYLSQGLDQIWVHVGQQVYLSDSLTKNDDRRRTRSSREYTYVSPVIPIERRKMSNAERGEIYREAEQRYGEAMRANPDIRDEIESEKEATLLHIRKQVRIPDWVVIREYWDKQLVNKYLEESIEHIRLMLRFDWIATGYDEVGGKAVRSFGTVTTDGDRDTDKGHEVQQKGTNTIYRTHGGNWFSVPRSSDALAER